MAIKRNAAAHGSAGSGIFDEEKMRQATTSAATAAAESSVRKLAAMSQPGMKKLFRSEKRKSIKFGIGYRWRPSDTNVLVAEKIQN